MAYNLNLTDSNREALIIRWRRILILALMDFFKGTNDFNKIIVKEILDMNEALIKAFAETLGISLNKANGKYKRFNDIFEEIKARDLEDGFNEKLENLKSRFSSSEKNSLRTFRNNETHYLILPEIPSATLLRVWRMFYELVSLLDPNLFEYSMDRPEFNNFKFLQEFFKEVVLNGNKIGIDLNEIKSKTEYFPHKRLNRKNKTAEIEMENCIWDIIKRIEKGEH